MTADKRTTSVPLETENGERVIEQQNVGSGVELGGGEYPDPHTPPTAPAPGAVASSQTLVEVIAEFERDGFSGQFMPDGDGRLRCLTCNKASDAKQVRLHALRRLEGASDPADMAALAGLECPQCGTRGTIALKYGPDATPDEADVLRLLDR